LTSLLNALHCVVVLRAMTRRTALTAQDDREVNVAGARAAGWAAVHFTGSAEQLEAALAAMGVSF
jgi:hypothetical protein